jgi:5-methylcytosine-specific restriction protein A
VNRFSPVLLRNGNAGATSPNMAHAPREYRPAFQASRAERNAECDQRRGSSASRGYGSKWRLARAGYLAHHPLCVECEKAGRSEPATVVDHVIPHRGDWALFWDSSNWQSLCKPHHDSWKQAQEKKQQRG